MPNRLPSWEEASASDAREKMRRMRERIEQFDEFFWVFDPTEDCFIYVGAAYPRIWMRSRADLTGDTSSFFEAIHPDDRERIRKAYRPDRTGAYDQIYRVQRPDGSIRLVRDRAFPMLNGQQRVKHFTGLISDITDIGDTAGRPYLSTREIALPNDQRPTIQLDDTQKRYRALFLESADAAILFDGHGYIAEANHHAAKLFGFERHELVRMHFSSFFSDDTLASAVKSWEIVRGGQDGCRVTSMLCKDAKSIEVEIAASLVNFGAEYIVYATFRPVMSQQQISHELEATRDQLARVQKMELIGQIAGGAAHDFNNLLSVMTGFAEVLKLRVPDNPEAQRDTRKILEAGESAALLVRRLLTLARYEKSSPETLNPGALIERTCSLLERSLGKDITLSTEVAEDVWSMRIDRVELEQIIMNLGINAADAMPEGGEIEIETKNFVNSPTTAGAPAQLGFGRYIHIRVRDSGVGMDKKTRARIFEPFFSTKPKSRGTGLGLATVKDLVSRNKGRITVDSEPAKGTQFDLYFPKNSIAE